MKFTISIITYTQLEYVKRCLPTVLKTRGNNYKLVLTANGSELAYQYFNRVCVPQRGDIVIKNETNLGFIEPSRKAFEHCDTPYFVMLNDDAMVPDRWLELMENEFKKHPTAALVANRGAAFGLKFEPYLNGCVNGKKEFLVGACMMCRTDLLKEHGLFHPFLEFAFGEDIELSLRMRSLGYTIHEAPFRIIHAGHATAKHIPGIEAIRRKNHEAVFEHYKDFLNGHHPEVKVVYEDVVARLGGFRVKTWRLAEKLAKERQSKRFIETGCYRGTHADGCSTVILATFAARNGGTLQSYELSHENIAIAKKTVATAGLSNYVKFIQGDAVQQLAARSEPIDFAYLDSYDMGKGPDFSECQKHQLAELETVLPMLSHSPIVVLDDHVGIAGKNGKTMMSLKRLPRLPFDLREVGYQIVLTSDNPRRLTPHKFCVLTGHLPNYAALAAQTIYRNKASYCYKHGYDLKVIRAIPKEFFTPGTHANGFSWGRLALMLRLVESGAYEWVWCVGCDTMITNMDVKLETLVKAKPIGTFPEMFPIPPFAPRTVMKDWIAPKYKADGRAHVVFCGDRGAPLQADSFLVRGSPQGAAYLRDILDQWRIYQRHVWVENQAMIDLRFKHAAITALLPQHRMNSFEYKLFHHMGPWYKDGLDCYGNRGDWKPGDFLVHWPATSLAKRLELCATKQINAGTEQPEATK